MTTESVIRVMRRFAVRAVVAAGLVSALAAVLACSSENELILATTTSTQDSGLLDVLVPAFEKEYGYNVKTIAVGSGQALAMGEKGEADVILSHSPKAEEDFMAAGNGADRQLVMHNDFVVIGPKDDPAGIAGMKSAAGAFAKIAGAGAKFVSRGDQSGTNTKELALWKTAGTDPAAQSWYVETGQGMGATLMVTNDMRGYTLTDRATYLAQRDNIDLDILVEGDSALFNIYHVIVVNPDRHPSINEKGAREFAAYVTSPATQETIRTFAVGSYGQPLFVPDAYVAGTAPTATAAP